MSHIDIAKSSVLAMAFAEFQCKTTLIRCTRTAAAVGCWHSHMRLGTDWCMRIWEFILVTKNVRIQLTFEFSSGDMTRSHTPSCAFPIEACQIHAFHRDTSNPRAGSFSAVYPSVRVCSWRTRVARRMPVSARIRGARPPPFPVWRVAPVMGSLQCTAGGLRPGLQGLHREHRRQ